MTQDFGYLANGEIASQGVFTYHTRKTGPAQFWATVYKHGVGCGCGVIWRSVFNSRAEAVRTAKKVLQEKRVA